LMYMSRSKNAATCLFTSNALSSIFDLASHMFTVGFKMQTREHCLVRKHFGDSLRDPASEMPVVGSGRY
jgi:hypothetical protein